jgi:hypothetical protein
MTRPKFVYVPVDDGLYSQGRMVVGPLEMGIVLATQDGVLLDASTGMPQRAQQLLVYFPPTPQHANPIITAVLDRQVYTAGRVEIQD